MRHNLNRVLFTTLAAVFLACGHSAKAPSGHAVPHPPAARPALVASLAPEDRIAVIVFDSKAEVLLPSTRLDDADAKDLKKKIGAMKATGTTDMAAGLRMAIAEV